MKVSVLIVALVGLTSFSTATYSHPGRTASDGCHYCRTNCDYWGVPWNQRHCHYDYAPTTQDLEHATVLKEYEDDEVRFVTLLEQGTYKTFEVSKVSAP